MVRTVGIVTDSIADIPASLAKELGIIVVPLNLRFGSEVFRDGVDITPEQFYERLSQTPTMPVTSIPAAAAFAAVYDKLAEEVNNILVITIAVKLSGAFDVARQGIALMKKTVTVEVVDSEGAAMAEGLIVITAARAAQAGAKFDEIKQMVEHNIKRVDIRAAFDTLDYLKRGGRIGLARAFLGSVLKFNPIIALKDGVVYGVARTRSRAKAIDYLYNFVMSYKQIDELAIEDAATPDEAEALVERLGEKFPKERIIRAKATPVIGAHTGPHVLVVTVLGDK